MQKVISSKKRQNKLRQIGPCDMEQMKNREDRRLWKLYKKKLAYNVYQIQKFMFSLFDRLNVCHKKIYIEQKICYINLNIVSVLFVLIFLKEKII